MRNIIKKILRESDELDWIRNVNPLPPFPLSEENLYLLIGWSILYDPHKPYGAWHHDGMTFPITKIQGGNVTWLYDNGKKENYDTITSFLNLINNGTWVLVSPEGVLYDPLYAREWKGGTYYSKEDLNESHDWNWVQSEKLYNPFDEPLAVIWFDRTINRDEAEVLFGLMSEAGISSHRSKQNLIKLFMGISKDSYLRIFRSNHYGQHFSIGSYDPHPDAPSFDDIKYADVHKDLVGKPYLEYNVSDLFGNTINESSEWSWVTDGEPYHDVEFYVGKPLKVNDPTSSEDYNKSNYRIERTVESPEAYNICWDEVIPDNEGAEGVYKVCTRYRATSIIRMFEDGTLSLDLEKLNESEDDLQWIKDIEPEIKLEPNTIYWFKPNLTKDEIVDFAGKINNSDYFSDLLFRFSERPDIVYYGLKYFVVGDSLDELDGWCTSYPIKHATSSYPSAKLVDARERFGYN